MNVINISFLFGYIIITLILGVLIGYKISDDCWINKYYSLVKEKNKLKEENNRLKKENKPKYKIAIKYKDEFGTITTEGFNYADSLSFDKKLNLLIIHHNDSDEKLIKYDKIISIDKEKRRD